MRAVLYSFRRCPYAMRARMALTVSARDYEHREIALRDKPAAMLDASPKGTVPVFITSEGMVIDESLEIMFWALSLNDPAGWLDGDRSETEDLIQVNDGPFKYHLDRYKYASRYNGDKTRGEVDISHRQQAETFIQTLEDRLSDQACLMGPRQSLADFAIFPFLRQFANTDRACWDAAPYPHVRQWLDRHVNSDLFATIMAKYPLWSPS